MPTPLTDADKVLRNDTGKDIVEKLDDIAQALGVGVNADQINYDNTTSGLESENVQEAIDEVKEITDDLDDKLNTLTNIISTASGTIATFNDGGDNIPVKSLVTEITATQAGTGTPSPTNVRPITGFDSVEIVVNSQNYIDFSTAQLRPIQSGSSAQRVGFEPVVLPAGTYHIKKYPAVVTQIYVSNYDDGTTIANNNTQEFDFTLTAPTNVIVRTTAQTMKQFTLTDLLCVLKSDSTTHTITLPETIYGGTAELVGGSGTKTLDCVDLGDLSWTMGSTNIGFYANLPNAISPISSGDINAICSCYERIDSPSTTTGLSNLTFCVSDGSITTQKRVFIRDDSYNGDVSLFVAGVTGQKLVYTLATPTAFSFAETNIPTLSGENNIYSNCGDVEVEYFNSKADWLADLIRVMSAT